MHSEFTKNDTLFSKGVALCLLLVHHLFFSHKTGYIGLNIGTYEIFSLLSIIGKVCITIFVILSGYGLAESMRSKAESYVKFTYRHLKKIYQNYWFIWFIFVPIGIFAFGRTFQVVYSQPYLGKLAINFLGLQELFGFYGYNPTWWFVSLIVILYLIFPLLIKIVNKLGVVAVILFCCFMYIDSIINVQKIAPLNTVYIYLSSFVLGIYLSKVNGLALFKSFWINKKIRWIVFPLLLILFSALRIYIQLKFGVLAAIKTDVVYGLFLILFFHQFFSSGWFYRTICFIGIHSFNIFLFHTFIFSLYFAKYIYYFKYPPIIFLVLLVVCLVISVLLEKIKTIQPFLIKRKKAIKKT